ncbi:MAG: threonine--tRNA ligase [Clostridiales bacterium]|jgi:threonyl-tRNA synthetase|nr:threonine--tRNA ligase [Clostridiales bacterium]
MGAKVSIITGLAVAGGDEPGAGAQSSARAAAAAQAAETQADETLLASAASSAQAATPDRVPSPRAQGAAQATETQVSAASSAQAASPGRAPAPAAQAAGQPGAHGAPAPVEAEAAPGRNLYDIAKSLGAGIEKAAFAAEVDGALRDLRYEPHGGESVAYLGFGDKGGRFAYRHTASHILAQAVKRLWPEAKLAIGPAIDSGFYYDIDIGFSFSPEDLEKIEKEMNRIIKENIPLERYALPRAEALEFFRAAGEPYKEELISDLPEGEEISLYRQGGFTDLCAGPHLGSTGRVKAVKLLSVAGAYWRGDEKNKMLQRIYGTAFPRKADLDEHLERLEEAKRRDHRKLGRELDLFDIYEEGPGFPFMFPKGMALRNELEDFWRAEHRAAGYEEIKTPIILNEELWHRSGHWDHYKDNMYFTEIDGEGYAIKPMNCPGGMLVYKRAMRSYRDLPIRNCEIGLVHRHELSGALHGLMRVRCFNQDDAHIYAAPEQAESEVVGVIRLIDKIYGLFGFKYRVELSTKPENSMGTDEEWAVATGALVNALDSLGRAYTVNEGDGAFYGPKIDFHLEDCLGRSWQCGTIQFDMQMPERFDLTYVAADGQRHRPVMLHRTVFGSIERFISILTEHFAGAFPTWLSPVQAKVLTVTDKHAGYAAMAAERLRGLGVRAEADLRNEKIGYKIREAQLQKTPYMLVVGEKEAMGGTVAVRSRAGGDLGAMPLAEFERALLEEIREKRL